MAKSTIANRFKEAATEEQKQALLSHYDGEYEDAPSSVKKRFPTEEYPFSASAALTMLQDWGLKPPAQKRPTVDPGRDKDCADSGQDIHTTTGNVPGAYPVAQPDAHPDFYRTDNRMTTGTPAGTASRMVSGLYADIYPDGKQGMRLYMLGDMPDMVKKEVGVSAAVYERWTKRMPQLSAAVRARMMTTALALFMDAWDRGDINITYGIDPAAAQEGNDIASYSDASLEAEGDIGEAEDTDAGEQEEGSEE